MKMVNDVDVAASMWVLVGFLDDGRFDWVVIGDDEKAGGGGENCRIR